MPPARSQETGVYVVSRPMCHNTGFCFSAETEVTKPNEGTNKQGRAGHVRECKLVIIFELEIIECSIHAEVFATDDVNCFMCKPSRHLYS